MIKEFFSLPSQYVKHHFSETASKLKHFSFMERLFLKTFPPFLCCSLVFEEINA